MNFSVAKLMIFLEKHTFSTSKKFAREKLPNLPIGALNPVFMGLRNREVGMPKGPYSYAP